MQLKLLVALSALAGAASAATRVAVLELGPGGAVRRSASGGSEATTADGVAGFWRALHRTGRRQLQPAGMALVPDPFRTAESGVVVGLGGRVDLAAEMPTVAAWFAEEGPAVGHMDVAGSHCAQMMTKLDDVEPLGASSSLREAVLQKAAAPGLSGVQATVSSANAAALDQQLGALVQELAREAVASGKTVVLHLVVDEDDASYRRRRLLSRRLEDEQNNNQNQNNNNNNNNNNAENANVQQYSGYYGYGYYNAYGEWVTPYKTMFQIQYFNVVAWTAVALVVALLYTLHLMTNMPLEADTLLFGESAKMIGDD